jgi:dihydrofolate reductase
MLISLIVAASENNVIGKNNQLLWKLPNDSKFFKNTTWGMPVIMGRKTFDSMKRQALPGRFNFVITRQKDWDPHLGNVQPCLSLNDAIRDSAKTDCREGFVIGGGQIYNEALPLAQKIYMTRVHAVLEGDAFFPEIPSDQWKLTSKANFPADEKHSYAYSFQTWEKIKNQ